MTDPNPTRSSRSRKRKAPAKPVETSPIVKEILPVVIDEEPTPEPTPEPAPKVVKPWEVVRPMPPSNPDVWPRGQKWRP
jgi:hypothetical protein